MKHLLSAATLDDILNKAYTDVLRHGVRIEPTNGSTAELFGVMLELTQPLARISRSQNRERIFSALGELLWYLSGSDDPAFVSHYVKYYTRPDVSIDGHAIGAYGPRLIDFDGVNQIETVISILKNNPASRNAVIQLFDHEDGPRHAPCTLALQFVVREGKLNMMTSMRSNDLFLGFPHDVFAFTMLQEIIAKSLDVDLGTYYHSVGSLHLYDKDMNAAREYLNEGWHDGVAMPAMPKEDPWIAINQLLEAEKTIRLSSGLAIEDLILPQEPYWKDLTLLIYIHKLISEKRLPDLAPAVEQIHHSYFGPIVQDRLDRLGMRKLRNDKS
ncbi:MULTISPECIES: thymidylate synthase [unclassified Arthrobacter]|uniref:thymidylate synthase n=1 Tax=unclassified Arthrobacter TaxID=235627 RepID=UPI001E30B021|nr:MULTISPECIES: thymidylate synthase [unclassified Arthrobacter]MCC9146847.1 thymidylate synthase [Arthrobacter sp. zg-Y919]MDK1278078.1 thymidylate synthase [Arthrobacter sp. zg.Y919]WIB03334.1 thymidylate synthase [Arthrobacter sp. zg-Y919]